MSDDIVINNFRKIILEKPVDKIISQIREFITSGKIKPGDKLPSERKLAEVLNIGRTHVREAIRKLEFYGILKTLPQNGTVVAGIGMAGLEGLISNVLELEQADFASLVETRVILEIESSKLAAERRTDSDLAEIENALNNYYTKINNNEKAIDEDMMFHLKITEASKNKVLKSLMLIIIPDIMTNYYKYNICHNEQLIKRYNEHKNLLECIKSKEPARAAHMMKQHLKDILKQGKELKIN